MLEAEGVARLEGAHCYEVYAGRAAFAALSDEEPGTFYLTDFLARNFERLVIRGLGLDRHPELLPLYFGNYRRLVFLAQTDDPALTRSPRRAPRAWASRSSGASSGSASSHRRSHFVSPAGASVHPGEPTPARLRARSDVGGAWECRFQRPRMNNRSAPDPEFMHVR